MFGRVGIWFLTAAAVCAAASHTSAAIVTWEFEAIVRGTDGPMPPWPHGNAFFVGQVFSGTLSFDTDVAGSGDSLIVFDNPVIELHISYPALAIPYQEGPFDLVPPSSPTYSNALMRDDLIEALAFAVAPAPSPLLLGIDGVQLSLRGPLYAPPFLDGTLPSVPPPLADLLPFDPALWASLSPFSRTGLFFTSGVDYQVGAELTSLRAVPEPAAAALALLTPLALACFRRASRGSIAG